MAIETRRVMLCDMCGAEDAGRHKLTGIRETPVTVDLCGVHAEPLEKMALAAPDKRRRTRVSTDADIAKAKASYARKRARK